MEVDVLRIDSKQRQTIKDSVTEEVFLTIHLNGGELLTLMCSPESLKELCAGFLYSSGIIHSTDDIEKIFINAKDMTAHITLKDKAQNTDNIFKRVYTSGCGRGMLFYNALDLEHKKPVPDGLTVSSGRILELMKEFEKKSEKYRKTGGVHSTALCDSERIVIFSEDIGRHNSLDKAVGAALYSNLDMEELIVLTSGRISSEVMFKVQKMRSAIVVSRSAPTDLSVRLAVSLNVTLIGFARGKRMNVYTATERIV